MPRAFSSGALSIWSYAMNVPPCFAAITFVSAAVSVVFPWSTCPIVPTFTCGFVRSNFALPMLAILWLSLCVRSWPAARLAARLRPSTLQLRDDLVSLRLRHFLVARELHRVDGPPLGQ